MLPGALLDIYDAAGSGYGQFRVLAVHHRLDESGNYTNHFEALPGAVAVPPPHPLAAAPLAQSELAEVIDLQDPRQLGRVRVRFQWAVAQAQDAESGWLRVSTPYSGHGKGQLFTPEVGSQVLVGYEQGLPEFPVVLGNLFHPKNQQGATYTTAENHLKGLQTAGGNKVVMSDVPNEQTILLSNSNKKGTAIKIGFASDGSVHIESAGPVTVNGSIITLGAGVPGQGETAYTGQIIMRAKTITLEAEEEIAATSKTKNVRLKAKTDITTDVVEGTMTVKAKSKTITTTEKLDISGGPTVSIKAGKVNINS